MSKSKIPHKVILELWVKAGGRCEKEGCNKYLLESCTAPSNFNAAEMAHIISDSTKGSRGDPKLSNSFCRDIDNLMLLCPSCHTEIDKKENESFFSVELLKKMKKEHEDRIRVVTGINQNKNSHVLTYYAGIGTLANFFTEQRIKEEILKSGYFSSEPFINLSMSNRYDYDDSKNYWQDEDRNLSGLFDRKIKPLIEENQIDRLLIYSMAPIPLLIKLGTLIDDKISSTVFQKHRDPDSWQWLNEDIGNFSYRVDYPEKQNDIIALNISLSGTIEDSRIRDVFPDKCVDICTITIANPSVNFLKNEEQLKQFSDLFIQVLDKLKATYGQYSELHIFPACPISIAIEIGRRWLKKCDITLIIYDQNNSTKKFIEAIKIDGIY